MKLQNQGLISVFGGSGGGGGQGPGGDANDVQINVAGDFFGSDLLEFDGTTLALIGGIRQESSANPSVLATVTAGLSAPLGIDEYGGYAYVANIGGGGSISSYDVTRPASPILLDTLADASLAFDFDVHASGRFLYVASGGGDLTVVDVQDPTNMVVRGSATATGATGTNTGPTATFVAGQFAYVCNNGSTSSAISIMNVSDPDNPFEMSSLNIALNSAEAFGVVVIGRYAIISAFSGDSLTIIDIGDPSAPVQISQLVDAVQLNGAFTSTVVGSHIFTACNGRLTITDMSDPTTPVIVGSIADATMNNAQGVAVSGRYAYVSGNTGLTIVDVSDVTTPVINAQLSTIVMAAGKIFLLGGICLITGNGSNNFVVVDVNGGQLLSSFVGNLVTGSFESFNEARFGGPVSMRTGLSVGGGIDSEDGMSAPTFNDLFVADFLDPNGFNPSIRVGNDSLDLLTTARNAVFIGDSLAPGMVQADRSVMVGARILINATDAGQYNDNVFIGTDIHKNGSGRISESVLIGTEVGNTFGVLASNSNILIGNLTDVDQDGRDNMLNIGNLLFGNMGANGEVRIGLNSGFPTDENTQLALAALDKGFLPNQVPTANESTTTKEGLMWFNSDKKALRVNLALGDPVYASYPNVNILWVREENDLPDIAGSVILIPDNTLVFLETVVVLTDAVFISLPGNSSITGYDPSVSKLIGNFDGSAILRMTDFDATDKPVLIRNIEVLNTSLTNPRSLAINNINVIVAMSNVGLLSDILAPEFNAISIARSALVDMTVLFNANPAGNANFSCDTVVFTQTVINGDAIVIQAGFTIGDFRMMNCQFNLLDATNTGIAINAGGGVARGTLQDNTFVGPGNPTDAVATDNEWEFDNNVGLGGSAGLGDTTDQGVVAADNNPATAIPITTIGVWVGISGLVGSYAVGGKEQKFILINAVNGDLQYKGVRNKDIKFGGYVVVENSTNTEVEVEIGISVDNADPDLHTRTTTTLQLQGGTAFRQPMTIVPIPITLVTDNDCRLKIRNLTNTDNLLVYSAKLSAFD